MKFISDFADQAVMLPIVVVVAIASAAMGWWRGMSAWVCVTAGTWAIVLVVKFGSLACRPVFGALGIQSPSGHVAVASVVSGGLVALLTGRRTLALGTAVSAAILVGVARLELGAHSVPEVLIGAVLGVAGSAVISHFAGPHQVRRPLVLLAVTVPVALLLHGFHLQAETVIRHGAYQALNFVPFCRAGPELPLGAPGPRSDRPLP